MSAPEATTTRQAGSMSGVALPFEEIDASMLPRVGGKAANLGELTRAGFPVPRGYCVTTEAYAAVAAGAGLEPVLEALTAKSPGDSELAECAAAARQRLLAAPVPGSVASAITAAYPDGMPVAVRSSATAEDLPFASFAGQQDTFLGVVGTDAVLDAVRRCWASLWTDRAVSYRAANGIDHRTVRLAVVVQRMIEASTAGVMFTANPLSGRRHQAVIDASPGLGEAVVSGAVNPDHFVVDPATGDVLERRLGDKRMLIRSAAGGGTERRELPDGTTAACVDDRELASLAALGARVEDHYGAPQDTEWAIDADGVAWLTQARPITTLYPLPDRAPDDGPRVYFSANVAQGVFRPLTPAGIAAFRMISGRVLSGLFEDPRFGVVLLAGTAADGALTGTPASPGQVSAPARVVLDPAGARLEPGEILVAPSTDPGWTPLFLTAGGLVMEMGGAMSHGAVVAREYGIPAVVGVAHATDRIRSGRQVTVDGSAGVVESDWEA